MKAMILAAGRGTRLGVHSQTVPKVMQTIAGKPLIGYHLAWLRSGGRNRRGDQSPPPRRPDQGLRRQRQTVRLAVHYSPEETLLETGGGIVAALPVLGTSRS